MTKFEKPESRAWEYTDMTREAATKALEDAGVGYEEVHQAYVSFVQSRSTSGQRSVYQLGMTGIPVVNVNNNCASGATSLFLARQAISGGSVECVLALGFEKMKRGPLDSAAGWAGPSPLDNHLELMRAERGTTDAPVNTQLFGSAGREHMERYGSTPKHFAWIGWKNHKHSVNNPYAQFQVEYSMDEILGARMIFDPLTKLQCSPTSDGAAAAILASENFVERHQLWDRAVEIIGQSMTTDSPAAFGERSCIEMVGADMTRRAASDALTQAGLTIDQVDVIELHDCFSTNELITYEGLGMADPGKGHQLVEEAATTYGGQWVVNPSGGLISKGHPLGATGLAQCAELTWQVRGTAGGRQVEGARVGLQHNLGLGGACVVSIFRRP